MILSLSPTQNTAEHKHRVYIINGVCIGVCASVSNSISLRIHIRRALIAVEMTLHSSGIFTLVYVAPLHLGRYRCLRWRAVAAFLCAPAITLSDMDDSAWLSAEDATLA